MNVKMLDTALMLCFLCTMIFFCIFLWIARVWDSCYYTNKDFHKLQHIFIIFLKKNHKKLKSMKSPTLIKSKPTRAFWVYLSNTIKKGQTCLLIAVLQDEWSEDAWENLKGFLYFCNEQCDPICFLLLCVPILFNIIFSFSFEPKWWKKAGFCWPKCVFSWRLKHYLNVSKLLHS